MKYQGGNKRQYITDLANHVFSLLDFSNECHDPHSGEFCKTHNAVHPSALAAASSGYGIERWQREQKMKKDGLTNKPYGRNPERLSVHLSDRLKDIGITMNPDEINNLIKNETPVYIQHENSKDPNQNPVYHYNTKYGFELGFAISKKDGAVTTVYPTGYEIEAAGYKAHVDAGSPRAVRGGPNPRADAKRALAKKMVQGSRVTTTKSPAKKSTKNTAPEWLTPAQAATYDSHKTQANKDAYIAQVQQENRDNSRKAKERHG